LNFALSDSVDALSQFSGEMVSLLDAAERLLTKTTLDASAAVKLRVLLASRRAGFSVSGPSEGLRSSATEASELASIPPLPQVLDVKVCCACEVPFLPSQSPAGRCKMCGGAEGLLCMSCLRTHRKGAFAGHEAVDWESPVAGILAGLNLSPALPFCAAHIGRPLEFHCLACPEASPALCTLCLRLHRSHGDQVILLSDHAQRQRDHLKALVLGEEKKMPVDVPEFSEHDLGTSLTAAAGDQPGHGLVEKARSHALKIAAAKDALPAQVDAALARAEQIRDAGL